MDSDGDEATHSLYLVGTPIGNLEDISPRALEVLRSVGLIAAENPAKTQRLLTRYHIHTPMMRFTDAYERKKKERLDAVLVALGRTDVALVSEAGMPLLADPGYELLRALIERGVSVIPVPGPTALMMALSLSGLATEAGWVFLGFLSHKAAARRRALGEFIHDARALACYESPHRLVESLGDALAVLGDRQVAVCGELTKLYEQVWRGRLSQAVLCFEQEPPRGEYVLVIAPSDTAT